MARELRIYNDDFTTEVAWMSRLSGSTPVGDKAIQVTTLLNALQLRRVGYEQYRETVLPAEGVGQESITVSATILLEALRKLSGQLSLSISDGQLTIKSVNRTVRIKALQAEFPAWPQFAPVGDKAVISGRQLARVLTSASTGEDIPALTVVAFDSGTMVATDRFRLTRVVYDDKGFNARISAAALRAFAKPHENSGVVYVQPGEVNGSEWVEITSAGRTLLTPLVDVDFPRWKSLIPDNAPLRVALRRAELLEATSGEEIILTIDNDDDEVTVVSVNGDLQIEQRIELFQRMRDEFDEPFTVKLRSKFVEEALRNISSAVVLLEVSGPTKPVVLRDVSELDLHLVMPLKTEGAEAKAG